MKMEVKTAKFLFRSKYSASAVSGMMANPHDRSGPARAAFEAAGVRVIDMNFCPATAEVIAIVEAETRQVNSFSFFIYGIGAETCTFQELLPMEKMVDLMTDARQFSDNWKDPSMDEIDHMLLDE